MRCSEKDIHVHHINISKFDNTMDNLEVLHKDEHAKRHGKFASWKQYQYWRRNVTKKSTPQ